MHSRRFGSKADITETTSTSKRSKQHLEYTERLVSDTFELRVVADTSAWVFLSPCKDMRDCISAVSVAVRACSGPVSAWWTGKIRLYITFLLSGPFYFCVSFSVKHFGGCCCFNVKLMQTVHRHSSPGLWPLQQRTPQSRRPLPDISAASPRTLRCTVLLSEDESWHKQEVM